MKKSADDRQPFSQLTRISGDTIKYSVEEVKKALGQPGYEGHSMIEDSWELSYKVGEYVLFFFADRKDGNVHYMTFKKIE
jgi:hypothetical protein